MSAAKAADILRRFRAGTFRFSPPLDAPDGSATFPPGWKPQPYQQPFKPSAAQLEKMAEARRVSNEVRKKTVGRRSFTED